MRDRIDRALEWAVLGCVLGALVTGALAFGGAGTLGFLAIQGWILAAGACGVARWWVQRESRLLFPPVSGLILLFLAYAGWRYATSPVEYVAREEWVRICVYALCFFVVVAHLNRAESINLIVYVLVFTGMAISIYALYQFLTGSNSVWGMLRPEQYEKRGSGTYICPNHLAGFLELVLPLGLTYVLMGRMSPVLRIVLGYACLVILAGIAATVSRGGWVATGISLGLMFLVLVRRQDTRLPALVSLLVVVGAGLFLASRIELSPRRVQELFTDGAVENIRFRLWRPAVQIWQEAPWTGAGLAHFDTRFRQVRPGDVQMRPDRVHNDYLNVLADMGIIGMVLLLACGAAVTHGLVRSWKFANKGGDLGGRASNRGAFLLGAGTGMVAILAHSMVDFNLHIPANALVAVVLVALISVHWRFATERFWVSLRVPARLAASLLLVGLAAYLADRATLRFREHRALARAAASEAEMQALERRANEAQEDPAAYETAVAGFRQRRDELRSGLEEAFRIEPANFQTAYRIGELHRQKSWQAESGAVEPPAREAIRWFERAMQINPFDPYSPLRIGMCLDWIGDVAGAGPHFKKAERLDPNGYYTVAHLGWHALYLEQYQVAFDHFERSLRLKHHDRPEDNPIAARYLEIARRRLEELDGIP